MSEDRDGQGLPEQENHAGWVPVPRSVWVDPEFKDLREAAIWVYFLTKAAWKPTTINFMGKNVALNRGELIISERWLAAQFSCGRGVISRATERLKTRHLIRQEARQGEKIITICNYEEINFPKNGAEPPREPPSEPLLFSERATHKESYANNIKPKNEILVAEKKSRKSRPPSEYAYVGHMLKITHADWGRLFEKYPHIAETMREVVDEYDQWAAKTIPDVSTEELWIRFRKKLNRANVDATIESPLAYRGKIEMPPGFS